MMEDVERILVCEICGADACFGFGVTLDGVRMGDVGNWRCAEHHPARKARYTREEWAQARVEGRLYPDPSEPKDEWQKLSDITARILSTQQAAE